MWRRLLGDALHCEPGRVAALAELDPREDGRQSVLRDQFLTVLVEEALLAFDHGEAAVDLGPERIRAKGYTDNVADLMAAKLSRLPQRLGRLSASWPAWGMPPKTATLALVHEASEEATHAALWEAVRAGLVLRSGSTYAFLHDRIQEAAYALIAEASGPWRIFGSADCLRRAPRRRTSKRTSSTS